MHHFTTPDEHNWLQPAASHGPQSCPLLLASALPLTPPQAPHVSAPNPQAASTDQIVAGADGQQHGNGAAGGPPGAGAEEQPVVVDLAAVQASLEAKYQAGSNGNGASSNGNGASANGASANGSKAPAASVVVAAAVTPPASPTVSIDAADGVEGFMPPEEAGQLEAAAQEALAEEERKGSAPRAAPTSAAGTPYVAPGGRWSQFKSYSTFQRTWDIWRFGLTFFFKLWCINQVGRLQQEAHHPFSQNQYSSPPAVNTPRISALRSCLSPAAEIHLQEAAGRHERGQRVGQAQRAGCVAARGAGAAGPHLH